LRQQPWREHAEVVGAWLALQRARRAVDLQQVAAGQQAINEPGRRGELDGGRRDRELAVPVDVLLPRT
jgi:hypothetical protein